MDLWLGNKQKDEAEENKNNPPGIEGASIANGGRVIILEDVTTTGGSAIQAVKRIEEETDCEVVAAISILDREEGGKEAFQEAGIRFESLSKAYRYPREQFAVKPSDADSGGPTTVDTTAPKGLIFQYADEAKPLATPWQVAVERAKMVRKCKLPDGPILDPACGSGIQLAAYCSMLSRTGLGIEMDEATARAANSNLRRVAEHGFGTNLLESGFRSVTEQ